MKIDSWVWSDGLSTSPVFCQEITATEAGGSPVTVQLASPLPFSAALAQWASLLTASASLSGTYAFALTDERVSLSVSGPASVSFSFGGQLARGLGFGGSLSGSTSYTAPSPPRLSSSLLGVDVEVSDTKSDAELREFRHGRHSALFFSTAEVFRARLVFEQDKAPGLLDGWNLAGKVRLSQGSNANPYSPTHVDGVIDAFVFGVSPVEALDNSEKILSVELLLSRGI